MTDATANHLLVDIGNTALRWCSATGLPGGDVGYCAHHGDDLSEVLDREWGEAGEFDAVWAGSVAGEQIDRSLADWLHTRWGAPLHLCRVARSAFGVRNGYRDPSQLGVDRWLAMIAARRRVTTPVCVVDCGTATTIDALNADGEHLGGYIVPGVGSMRRALLDYTRIPRVDHADTGDGFGHDTASGVAAGSRLALTGAVTRACRHLQLATSTEPCVLLTGSEAALIADLLPMPHRHLPHLVLEGVARYAQAEG